MRPDRLRTALVLASSVILLCLTGATAAAGTRPGTADVVVREDFAADELPGQWRVIGGEWRVQGGRLVAAGGTGTRLITFGPHLTDYRFEATARFETAADTERWFALGLDVPASGAGPWQAGVLRTARTTADRVEFAARTPAGSWSVSDTSPAPAASAAAAGRDVKVRIEVRDRQAAWFIDSRQVMRTSRLDRSPDGVLALAVGGSTVSFDDVKVTALGTNVFLRAEGAPLTVVAHRGASSLAPENTMVAQEVGRRSGADFIETDVRLSRDRVPYLMHDATVDRTTDGTGNIATLTAAQLGGLDAGSWFAPVFAGARVPTLATQLADLRTRGGSLLLEIKRADSIEDVAVMVDVVRAEKMSGRVLVQSFEPGHLRWVRELAPDLPLGLLRSALDADPVAISKELHLTSYNPSGVALDSRPGVVADLHGAGVAAWVWTVDSAEKWARYDRYGVDGIITNRPGELTGWSRAQSDVVAGPARRPATVTPPR